MAAVKVPPSSLEAEASVLSHLFYEPEAFAEIRELLEPQHFYADANRRIYEAILELQNDGKTFDIVSVSTLLRDKGRLEQIGGTPYLAQLSDATPAVADVTQHARIVREKWRVREFIARCQAYATEGHAAEDVQSFLEGAEREIAALAEVNDGVETEHLRDILARSIATIEANQARGSAITGTPTGFTRLDRQCSGLQAGDLYILAARPGMGKTAFALAMTVNVAAQDDGAALFCSLEMPRDQLGQRMLASEARVPLTDVRNGHLDGVAWSRIHDAASRLAQASLWIDDAPAMSIHQVRAKIKRTKMRARGRTLRLVTIDYLQLMRGRENAGSREQEISELSRGLKALAKEEKIAIVALSQLNRAVESRNAKDKRPQLSDLRESGAIEQDADLVMFIYRDEYYFKDSEAKGLAELIIAKQRNGPPGTVVTKFTGEFTRFDNLEAEEFSVDRYDDFFP